MTEDYDRVYALIDMDKVIQDNKLNVVPDTTLLKGKRVAVIVMDGVEEIELTFVRKILIDRGAEVHIVSPKKPSYPPILCLVPMYLRTEINTSAR